MEMSHTTGHRSRMESARVLCRPACRILQKLKHAQTYNATDRHIQEKLITRLRHAPVRQRMRGRLGRAPVRQRGEDLAALR